MLQKKKTFFKRKCCQCHQKRKITYIYYNYMPFIRGEKYYYCQDCGEELIRKEEKQKEEFEKRRLERLQHEKEEKRIAY